MTDRERLIELMSNSGCSADLETYQDLADYLLANGVIVPPVSVGQTVLNRNGEINGFRGYEDKIKAEAYKEFAERLKEQAKTNEWNGTICGVDIDNLLKELVGEDNESTN